MKVESGSVPLRPRLWSGSMLFTFRTNLSIDLSKFLSILVIRTANRFFASCGVRSSNSSASFLDPRIASWSNELSCSSPWPWWWSLGLKAPSSSLSPLCFKREWINTLGFHNLTPFLVEWLWAASCVNETKTLRLSPVNANILCFILSEKRILSKPKISLQK